VEEPDREHKRSVKEKGTEAIAKARARAEELRIRAEANRPRSRAIDIVFGSYERDTEVGGGILAGAVAFRVFLFIVPFVFFFVVAFGLVADAVGTTASSATNSVGITGLLGSTITNVGDQSVWSRLTILGVSGVALVLGARNLMKVLVIIHVLIWHVPRVRVRRQVRAVALLVASVLGALALAQVTNRLQDNSFPAWVFATSAFMLVPAGLWLVASLKLFPHPPEVDWQDMVPGALLVGVGIEALHVFTVVYISHSFERKSETYGAIGGSLSLLLWAYVVGRILAASPVVNAVVWRRAHAHDLPPPVVPNLPPPVVSDPPPPSSPAQPRSDETRPLAGEPESTLPPPPTPPALAVTVALDAAALPPPTRPSASTNGGVLPPPVAPGNGVLPPPMAAGNGRPTSPTEPAPAAPAALPPPLATTVVGPPGAAVRDAPPPPLPIPVPPG
jgi:membrane protein